MRLQKRTVIFIRYETDAKGDKLLAIVRYYLELLRNKKNLLVTVYDGEYHIYDESFLEGDL